MNTICVLVTIFFSLYPGILLTGWTFVCWTFVSRRRRKVLAVHGFPNRENQFNAEKLSMLNTRALQNEVLWRLMSIYKVYAKTQFASSSLPQFEGIYENHEAQFKTFSEMDDNGNWWRGWNEVMVKGRYFLLKPMVIMKGSCLTLRNCMGTVQFLKCQYRECRSLNFQRGSVIIRLDAQKEILNREGLVDSISKKKRTLIEWDERAVGDCLKDLTALCENITSESRYATKFSKSTYIQRAFTRRLLSLVKGLIKRQIHSTSTGCSWCFRNVEFHPYIEIRNIYYFYVPSLLPWRISKVWQRKRKYWNCSQL